MPINGQECNYTNWFHYTYNPSFLGIPFNRSVHYLLIRQLRIAESYLLGLPGFKGCSLVEMAAKTGLSKATEKHAGRTGDAGMHIYGLTVDIDHGGNPWVGAAWIRKPKKEIYDKLSAAERSRLDEKLNEKVRFVDD